MGSIDLFEVFTAPIRDNVVLVLVALAFILLDFILGFTGAVIRREVSSKVLREGIGHKLASVAFLVVAALLDAAIGTGKLLGMEPVMVIACIYLILMEIISCLENIRRMNPDLEDNPIEQAAEEIAKHMKEEDSPTGEGDDDLYLMAEDMNTLREMLGHGKH